MSEWCSLSPAMSGARASEGWALLPDTMDNCRRISPLRVVASCRRGVASSGLLDDILSSNQLVNSEVSK